MKNDLSKKVLDGIKGAYQVVAKRHVHPWYSWGLMAMAIGFSVGVVYVANQNVQFTPSRASDGTVIVMCPVLKSPFAFAGAGAAFGLVWGDTAGETTFNHETETYTTDHSNDVSAEEATKMMFSDDGTVRIPATYDPQFGRYEETDIMKPHVKADNLLAETKKKAVENCDNDLNAQQSVASGQCNTQKPTCETLAMCAYGVSAEPNKCGEATCSIVSRPAPSVNRYVTDIQWGIECKSSAPTKKVSCACTGKDLPNIPVEFPGENNGDRPDYDEPEGANQPPVIR